MPKVSPIPSSRVRGEATSGGNRVMSRLLGMRPPARTLLLPVLSSTSRDRPTRSVLRGKPGSAAKLPASARQHHGRKLQDAGQRARQGQARPGHREAQRRQRHQAEHHMMGR
jgi:hypothetical protein